MGNQYTPAAFGVMNGLANGFATTVVTGPLSATLHMFVLARNQLTGDVEFEGPQTAAALVGSG